MKKIVLAAAAASALLVSPVFAAANENSNGVGKNCFGQGRSEYASNNTNTGEIISQRAQTPSSNPDYPNQNVQLNKEYKEQCQAAATSTK